MRARLHGRLLPAEPRHDSGASRLSKAGELMVGRLHQQGDPCPACDGTGRLPEPAEERAGGYIDGPAPAAVLWISRVSGWSGLGVADQKAVYLFSERFKSTERDALRDMEDG